MAGFRRDIGGVSQLMETKLAKFICSVGLRRFTRSKDDGGRSCQKPVSVWRIREVSDALGTGRSGFSLGIVGKKIAKINYIFYFCKTPLEFFNILK